MTPELTPTILHGTLISPGLAEGLIHVHQIPAEALDLPVDSKMLDIDDEMSRLDLATEKVSDDLFVLAKRVEKEIDARLAEVFDVHQLILEDSSLQKELRHEIVENLASASSAVKTVFLRWENRFLLMESQVSREKGDDMKDVSNRLCNVLDGITVHPLEEIPEGCLLAIKRLLPSDTIFLGGRSTSAVLLEFGSAGSHAALFAREMGLPCISGLVNLVSTVANGTPALVDAEEGLVILCPSDSHKTVFREKVARKAKAYSLAREKAKSPARTKDDIVISVLANVGCKADTELAVKNGADGVGLYRIERAYMGRVNPPCSDELYQEMYETLGPALGKPVCIRLLDIGADKPLLFLKFMAESNPSLGRRGIRLLREYPELLDTQLRTVLKLAGTFDVSILVPMVTLPEDMAIAKERLLQLASEMLVSRVPKLGAMIETPAAALLAAEIAEHADFLSFGTNDLTQYIFAADRENAAVESYYNDGSEAIFKMLQITHGDVPQMSLSVCGELAGRPEHVQRLLDCGIRTLSVTSPLVPSIKEAVRNCDSATPIREDRIAQN